MFVRNIVNIWKREIKGYLYTPIAYVFVGAFSMLMGLMFWQFLSAYMMYTMQSQFGGGQTVTIDRLAEAFYGNMHVVLMFILPFLTMRLFTEESRQNTLALLMTSPVRTWEMVLAKFKAATTILLVMLFMTLICPVFLMLYSASGPGPDLGVMGTTYLGLLLVGMVYIGVGLFWSSVTESQLIAVVLSFATNFSFWLVAIGGQGETAFQKVLKHIAINEQFQTFLKGTLELQSVVYFVSIIFLSLYLTNRALESRAWRS